jgi:hypothetical protein
MGEHRTVLGQLCHRVAHRVTRHVTQRRRSEQSGGNTGSEGIEGSGDNKLERRPLWLVAEILLVTVLVFFWL